MCQRCPGAGRQGSGPVTGSPFLKKFRNICLLSHNEALGQHGHWGRRRGRSKCATAGGPAKGETSFPPGGRIRGLKRVSRKDRSADPGQRQLDFRPFAGGQLGWRFGWCQMLPCAGEQRLLRQLPCVSGKSSWLGRPLRRSPGCGWRSAGSGNGAWLAPV